jgi:hypothetical protein
MSKFIFDKRLWKPYKKGNPTHKMLFLGFLTVIHGLTLVLTLGRYSFIGDLCYGMKLKH